MPYQTLLSGLYPPSPKLGLIEGFFGKGWSWEARARRETGVKKPACPSEGRA